MSENSPRISTAELTILSGAEVGGEKITAWLPDFVRASQIGRREVYVKEWVEVGFSPNPDYNSFDPENDSVGSSEYAWRERLLTDEEIRAYDITGQLPRSPARYYNEPLEKRTKAEIVSDIYLPEEIVVDSIGSTVYFTGESMSLGALRTIVEGQVRVGRSRYNDTNNGRGHAASALRGVRELLINELQLDNTTPEQVARYASDMIRVTGIKPLREDGAARPQLYLRPGIRQEEIDELTVKYNPEGLHEAREMGLPSNVRIAYRGGGRTNRSEGWVVCTDGSAREPDEVEGVTRYGNGTHLWRQILPGEAVLLWTKENTAAAHDFSVLHLPEKLTNEQLEAILRIEQEISDEWEGRTGLSSGKVSPSIGEGWGLCDHYIPASQGDDISNEITTGGGDVTVDMLNALRDRFNH